MGARRDFEGAHATGTALDEDEPPPPVDKALEVKAWIFGSLFPTLWEGVTRHGVERDLLG